MKIIVIASVPHTGTWFTIEFLRSHPDVKSFVEMQVLRKNDTLLRNPISGQAGLVPGVTNLVHGHITPDHLKLIQSFAATCPLIVPLRDPLASLITRQHRHPELSHMHIVEAWLDLAVKIDLAREVYEPCYFPIDLLTMASREDREAALCVLLSMAGVSAGHWGSAGVLADKWPVHNSRGDYPLKQAYRDGDMGPIRSVIPDEWGALVSAEHILRPFLERVGYRGLPWWHEQRTGKPKAA